MDKRLLSQLVFESYTNGILDEERIAAIADRLNRRQLKEYIKALKHEENKKSVEVTVPAPVDDDQIEMLGKIFPDKNIIYKNDPSLLSGIKVKNNDMIYDQSLKSILDKLVDHAADDI